MHSGMGGALLQGEGPLKKDGPLVQTQAHLMPSGLGFMEKLSSPAAMPLTHPEVGIPKHVKKDAISTEISYSEVLFLPPTLI